jgi:phytoene dehydrogenase-like protein
MESKKFDVIVIGGGPNGLTAGCYLAKAGQKVLIVDRRSEIGGGCAMEQSYVKHFWHNTHAIYFPMVDCAPAYKDLQLDQYPYNLKHIYPPHQFAMLFKDGRSISLYSDVEKSVNSISRFSQKDAKN